MSALKGDSNENEQALGKNSHEFLTLTFDVFSKVTVKSREVVTQFALTCFITIVSFQIKDYSSEKMWVLS